MPDTQIKIALADSSSLFRELVADFLQTKIPCDIVVSEGNGKNFVEQVEQLNTPPDLCIIGIRLLGVNGYDTVLHLRKHHPKLKILILTAIETDYSIFTMIRMGVNGYLLKNNSKSELVKAIHTIAKKGHYYSKIAPKKRYEATLNSDNNIRITGKEKEFLAFACTTLTFKEIGEQMSIGTRAVETHHESLNKKFNLRTRADLTLFAFQNGLIVANKEK